MREPAGQALLPYYRIIFNYKEVFIYYFRQLHCLKGLRPRYYYYYCYYCYYYY